MGNRSLNPTHVSDLPLLWSVAGSFFDEKPDNFFIRYQVKGAQIVETTLPCSFATFPSVASGACRLQQWEAFNVDEVEILRGISNLIGEVEIWQWQSWKSRFPLPFVIAPLSIDAFAIAIDSPTKNPTDLTTKLFDLFGQLLSDDWLVKVCFLSNLT